MPCALHDIASTDKSTPIVFLAIQYSPSPFPGLHAQLLSLAVRRPGWIYHMMRAAADTAGLPPAFRTLSNKRWAWRPGNEASIAPTAVSILGVWSQP